MYTLSMGSESKSRASREDQHQCSSWTEARPALTLMGGRIIVFPVGNKHHELPQPVLLKKPHQAAGDSLVLRCGHLGDPVAPEHVASSDLLEFEVAGNVGVNEHLGQLAIGHHELGNQVDCIVAITSNVLWRLCPGSELGVELGQVERGALAAVVVVPIDVKHLFAVDREQRGEHALRHACAADDGV